MLPVAASRSIAPAVMPISIPRQDARPQAGQRAYRPHGAAERLFYDRSPEVVLSGPAGTGKSRACLEKLYLCACKYPGMRALIARKTRASITQTAMVTFEAKVLPVGSPVRFNTTDQEYRSPNGSIVAVGGLDKASKVMSSEWDVIYVQEATELGEDDWESLATRLRNGVMPYQQLIGDTNPGPPTHWLKKRAERGATVMYESRHEDNPAVTPEYLALLDRLTGVRHKRLRLGIWAAAEGMVYENWDPALHVIDRFEVPAEWRRFRVIDFGYTNPFVCQWWAMDGDGRLYRYREIYMTGVLVQDAAHLINELSAGEDIEFTLADHDAEDRATLERYGIWTYAADKDVSPGLQAVQGRLRRAGDGRPRLFFLRDSLVERDSALDAARKPCCTEEEFEGYIWARVPGSLLQKEAPVKEDDHGMDCVRYMVFHLDGLPDPVFYERGLD